MAAKRKPVRRRHIEADLIKLYNPPCNGN